MIIKDFLRNFFKKEEDYEEFEIPTWFDNPLFENKTFLLEDYNLLKLYELYLRRAGHCPLCDDFLIVYIDKVNNHYKVTKHCVNHSCEYEEDVSKSFNEDLGINIFDNNDYRTEYLDRFKTSLVEKLDEEQNIPKTKLDDCIDNKITQFYQENTPPCTGVLKRSYDIPTRRYLYEVRDAYGKKTFAVCKKNVLYPLSDKIKVVDMLPSASRETMNYMYFVDYGEEVPMSSYVTVEFKEDEFYWEKVGEIDLTMYKKKYEENNWCKEGV